MSTYIPPTLTNWTEGRLTSILQAHTQDDFDQAFDNFLSQDADITFNGSPLSRDDYKKQLQAEGALNQEAAEVKFDASIELPDNKDTPKQSGLVSVFFDAIISERFLVFGGPAQRKVTSVLNVTVQQDDSLNAPEFSYFDARRVSVLNQIVTNAQVPIHLPHGPA